MKVFNCTGIVVFLDIVRNCNKYNSCSHNCKHSDRPKSQLQTIFQNLDFQVLNYGRTRKFIVILDIMKNCRYM